MSEVRRFGRINCEWARGMPNLDFCLRNCGLLGASICPRSPTFAEIMQEEVTSDG